MPFRRAARLSTAFLAAVVCVATATEARSQPHTGRSGDHRPLVRENGGVLSPEEVKRALEQLGSSQPLPPGVVEQIRERLRQEQPDLDPKQRDQTLQKILSDPKLLDRLAETAKNFRDSGKQPNSDELGKLLKGLDWSKLAPRGGLTPGTNVPSVPGIPDVPKEGLGKLPKLPDIRPDEPPINPGRDGEQPPFSDSPFGTPSFDFNETPRDRAIRAAAAMWEQNIGPLEETPAVKRALVELVTHTADLKDSKGNSIWDSLAKETGDGSAFGEFMSDASKSGWSWPDLDLPSLNLGWGRSAPDVGGDGSSSSSSGGSWWSRNRMPSSGGSGSGSGLNFGIPGLDGSNWFVFLVAIALLVACFYWIFIAKRRDGSEEPFDLGGLSNWPIDPRRITTRQDVVIAFEYLSVLICGPSAKTWTHNTIAEALSDLAATHGETAVMLARLYELARYAPLEEPLTTAEVAEARRLVCRLAGLDYES